jgi:hypothetical protein
VDRRTVRFFAAVLAVIAVVGIATAVLGGAATSRPTPPDAPTVDGVVVGVNSTGLANVTSFTLRTNDGRTLEFGLSDLGDGTAFPPGHLGEHVANSVPVRVWYRESGGRLDALWLEDAPRT